MILYTILINEMVETKKIIKMSLLYLKEAGRTGV